VVVKNSTSSKCTAIDSGVMVTGYSLMIKIRALLPVQIAEEGISLLPYWKVKLCLERTISECMNKRLRTGKPFYLGVRSNKMKAIYFCDPMGEPMEEALIIQHALLEHGINLKIKVVTIPPFDTSFDICFFDWGGMSIGNSMLEHFCRYFIDHAKEHPSNIYIMNSMFTKDAMEDALSYFNREHDERPANIYLDIDSSIPYLKALLNNKIS
jgi:hypothetical protein